MKNLQGIRVAILVADGFEESEMVRPRQALKDAGAVTYLISPNPTRVTAWNEGNWSEKYNVDVALDSAHTDDYDALVLPGGVINPDKLRMIPRAIEFITQMHEAGKPIAAICHGPWTLINAGAVRGLTVTSWPSLEVDLRNAGAAWVDEPVVRSHNLVTSRKPGDIPAFNTAMLELFSLVRH